jgi:HNH endonuclease
LTLTITPLTGGCNHALETPAYQPTPTLRHLVGIRHNTCVFPGCRRPAGQCDDDHTIPYDQGGRTCLCNLAPLCRKHHRCKQAEGWRLEHPEPGVLVWQTPAGRTYTITPTEYPV